MIEHCPPLFEFPAKSLAWKQAHFVYSWNQTNTRPSVPDYVCYDEEACSISYPIFHFIKLSEPSVILACEIPKISRYTSVWTQQVVTLVIQMSEQCASKTNGKESHCSAKNQFQCDNKCISKHRLVDYFRDCRNLIDERYNESCSLNNKHRLTCISNRSGIVIIKCVPLTNIWKGRWMNCGLDVQVPHFPTLCDGYTDYRENSNGIIDTNETNCD